MNWFELNRLLLLLLRPSRSCPLPPARSLPDIDIRARADAIISVPQRRT